MRTRLSVRHAITSRSRARSSPRPTRSIARRTSGLVSAAATSCLRSLRRARGARGGWPRPGVGSSSNVPRRPGRSRPRARNGCGSPSGAWRRSLRPSVARTRPMRPSARGLMRNGRRLGAHSPPKPYTPPATPQGRVNTTDPDSRVVKGLRGFIQGYNAQAVTNEHQVVIAAEVMTAAPDFGHLEPMLDAAQRELQAAGITDTPGVLLADAGYWHQRQMERIVDRGIPVLIPPDASKRRGARPGWDGGLYAFMRRVLATEHGGGLYRQRQPMIEPVFGQTKHNRGIDRFHQRGRAAVRTEWRLITATHNLLKLHRHTLAAA